MSIRPNPAIMLRQIQVVGECLADALAETLDEFLTFCRSIPEQPVPVRVLARKPIPQSPRSSDSRHGYLQS